MTHLFGNYARWDLELVTGQGTKVEDTNGKSYLDFTSGIGVCNLGHCHPVVTESVKNQLDQIWHTSNLFQISLQEEVAKKLTKNSCGEYVLFCNSGAEANEAAIKLARKYTGKSKIITFYQSFHGRTFATMAATGQDKVKEGFGTMLESFVHLPFNETDALNQAIDHETAAVMLEVIQGEGGVHPADQEFLLQVQNLCKQHNALLIIDEVQTGIGRTGKAFGYQHYSIEPDIITSAKGLGNGFPTGAIIAKEFLYDTFSPGSHGTTFGGNPLAMSAANATLELIFDEAFLTSVNEKGNYFYKKLNDSIGTHSFIKDIRYKGLMFGIECAEPVSSIISELREKGLIILIAGPNVIRLLPPLTVSYEELDTAATLISETLLEISNVSC